MTDSGNSDRRGWGDFWQVRRGESGYPLASLQRIGAVQQKCWEEFARSLPAGAAVLDLATGSGIVLTTMQQVRPDLQFVGIDSSPALPPAPSRIVLKAGVAMEKLPFADASFAAASSQFGYEYGHTASIAGEVGRILTPTGQLQLLMHHAESPVVAYHQGRHAALHWAVAESSCLERARHAVSADGTAVPTSPTFVEAASEAHSRFPDQPVAAEFITAVLRTIELGRAHPRQKVLEVLDTLEERAASEQARLETLARAACSAERIERIRAELDSMDFDTQAAETLCEPEAAAPFAWLLKGRRTAPPR